MKANTKTTTKSLNDLKHCQEARRCLQDNDLGKIPQSFLVRVSLQCLHMNVCSVGNKCEQAEKCTGLQGWGLVGIMAMWWDGSQDCNHAVEGYRPFRKDGIGRQRAELFYGRDQSEYMEPF